MNLCCLVTEKQIRRAKLKSTSYAAWDKIHCTEKYFLKAFPLLLSIHWEELLETAAAVAPRHVGANPQPVPIH